MAGYFREWRFDRSVGQIIGLDPLDPARLPAEYWRFVDNSQGHLERIEEHRPELSQPAIKLLTWEEGRIVEALDYNPDGGLRLIHQYIYNAEGYMVDRLELDGEERSRDTWFRSGTRTAWKLPRWLMIPINVCNPSIPMITTSRVAFVWRVTTTTWKG